MKTLFMVKKWTSIAVFVIGLCVVSIMGCKKSPEKIAELTNLLFDAIKSNDVEQAKLYIKAGANINAKKGESGITPLIDAVQHNEDEMVELLIKSKADVNKADTRYERTPLIWAIQSRNAEKGFRMVELLIKANADVNIKDKDGYTSLIRAVFRGDETVNLLIKAGADVNAIDGNGYTALMHAAYYENDKIKIVESLIKAGADVNAKNTSDGATALIYAAEHGVVETVDLLIKAGADLNAKYYSGETALQRAIRYDRNMGRVANRKDVIARLKAAGAQ